MTEPKNAIVKQYEKLFLMDGIKLVFGEGVLDLIVDKAIEYKLGARGLRSMMETIMIDAMYEAPSSKRKTFTVEYDYAKERLEKANFDAMQ